MVEISGLREIRTLRKVQGKAAESNSSVTYPLATQLPKRGMLTTANERLFL